METLTFPLLVIAIILALANSFGETHLDTTQEEELTPPGVISTPRAKILTAQRWKIISIAKEYQGNITNAFAELKSCAVGNLYYFKPNHYYSIEAGPTFYQAEQLYELDWMYWEFIENETSIKLSRFDRSPQYMRVVTISETILVLQTKKDGAIYQTTYRPE